MSIRRNIIVFTATVVAGAAVVAASVTSASADNRVIRLTAKATAINDFVDVGSAGPSPGDIYVFADNLFNANDVKVGAAEGRCNLIDPARGRFECTIVSSLPGGTITTDGILINVTGATSTAPITGGTGQFLGASGEASLRLGGPAGPHEVTFKVTN